MRAAAAGSAARRNRGPIVSVRQASFGRKSIHGAVDTSSGLGAAQKLSEGKVEEITLEELSEVCRSLSNAESGIVYYKDVNHFLQRFTHCTDVDLDTLQHSVAKLPGGFVTADHLYSALQQGRIQRLLKQALARNYHKSQASSEPSTGSAHIETKFLIDRVAWRVKRDDAFGTLPTTLFYFSIFISLLVCHLQIWRRQEVERGVEWVVYNYGSTWHGPYVSDHVYSMESFSSWVYLSGLPSMFSDFSERGNGSWNMQVASGTFLLGDARLLQIWGDDYEEKSIWLLGSANGTEYLKNHALDSSRFLDAARFSFKHHLDRSNRWVGDDTRELRLTMLAFNNLAEMFVSTEVRMRLDNLGHAKLIVKANAVVIRSYPSMAIIALDVVYVLLIFYTVWCESKEICDTFRVGWLAFVSYWFAYGGFWNSVDWITIELGFLNIALWLLCCQAMQAESLHALVDDSFQLRPNVVGLPADQMERISDDLREIQRRLFALHLSAAATAVFIILKFFKAFEANPRLQSVTQTLRFVSTDVLHFSVVLIPIYICFAVSGHVLFGGDLKQFYTIGNSFNTGVTVLMGEFAWYTDLSETPSILPSGMPRWALYIWFSFYMFIVLLVMLNMLLAIILERHGEVTDILSTRRDARTLWQQMWRWLKRKRETRGFVPLYHISHALENLDLHPHHIVTQQSLKEAFPQMKDAQAEWIMAFALSELVELHKKGEEDEGAKARERTERYLNSMAEDLHVMACRVTDCCSRIGDLEQEVSRRRFEVKQNIMKILTSPREGIADAVTHPVKVNTIKSMSSLALTRRQARDAEAS